MKALRYFIRALHLRCPMCGISPVFVPWHRLSSLRDWFTPLDGCPRCGYPYERETGYFLLSIWAVNYGIGSLMGISIYLVLETFCQLPLKALLFWVIAPVVVFNILFARHSKSLFLALDHYFDPHEKDGGDGGLKVPGQPNPPAPAATAGLAAK
ncbi:MAG: DUF983 domain-containing protein [Verrucomicrobia bacterium]|nr:DUF983 domain-containing protein [Verrucomicrobiota bacterium]